MRWIAIACALAVAACGGSDEPDRGLEPRIVDVPATIVGELEISVEEGPVGADDVSEVNFGSVATDEGIVLIEVWADVVRAAGLGRDELVAGGRYRMELTERAEYSAPDAPSYRVGVLERSG